MKKTIFMTTELANRHEILFKKDFNLQIRLTQFVLLQIYGVIENL